MQFYEVINLLLNVFFSFLRSNSHFAVGSMYGEKTELFDISPILKSPVGRFQTKPLCTLKVKMGINCLVHYWIGFYDNFV